MKRSESKRNLCFLLLSGSLLLFYAEKLRELVLFAYQSDLFLYVLLVPWVSGYFVYKAGKKAFSDISTSYFAGSWATGGGILLYWIAGQAKGSVAQQDLLGVITASLLMTWLGMFLLVYGIKAVQRLAFPLFFLFLMVPLPTGWVNGLTAALQRGSTQTTDWIFASTFLPITRQGFVFHLSRLSIEVAPECSGIRSALYLFLTGLVFAQLLLRSPRRKGLLLLAVFPIAVFKNGLRIATLALLGNYVDRDILGSSLHRQGGIPFMVLGVLFLAVVVELLRLREKKAGLIKSPPPGPGQCLEAAG